jgi:diaminohydroxyphosphoribosylaminopyrimidine deaminase/5-amino-6-(5-phosphoribosylamino)uracil reductase
MTLDGKIATAAGDSKWISNEASRRVAHHLRGRMDAIVVGIGTVLADDPLLTARPPGPRTPTRVILDSQGRLPASSQLAATAREVPVLLATANGSPKAEECSRLGCEICTLPAEQGRPSILALLDELGRRRMTNVLVEGGSTVLGSFLDAGAIDEVHVFIAPKLAGGAAAHTAIAGRGVSRIGESLGLAKWDVEEIGGDVFLHGWREW